MMSIISAIALSLAALIVGLASALVVICWRCPRLRATMKWYRQEAGVGFLKSYAFVRKNFVVDEAADRIIHNGDLDWRGVTWTSMPENLLVSGTLSVDDSALTAIAAGCTVHGDLNARRCPKLRRVHENVNVGGRFWTTDSPVNDVHPNLATRTRDVVPDSPAPRQREAA